MNTDHWITAVLAIRKARRVRDAFEPKEPSN
jgi:hypothetical protein